jgi:CRP/FNR family cyclic AMP-dependent transcriptional regulator
VNYATVESGRIKITAVMPSGAAAVIGICGPRDIFGETCLYNSLPRNSTATAIEPSTVFRVQASALRRAIAAEPNLMSSFVGSALARIAILEETLVDQMLNNSEKRLAGVLLRLARPYERSGSTDVGMPRLSHETLAEIVATTRPRITYFMNKFKKMGIVEYDGELFIRRLRLEKFVRAETSSTKTN